MVPSLLLLNCHVCNPIWVCLTWAARYITNRFLPDKAIDLVDEACANTRVQLDSQPEALDALERDKLRLEVEVTALKKEKDDGSVERLKKAEDKLAKLEVEYKALKSKYESERGSIDEVNKYVPTLLNELTLKVEEEAARTELCCWSSRAWR